MIYLEDSSWLSVMIRRKFSLKSVSSHETGQTKSLIRGGGGGSETISDNFFFI